MVLWQKMLTVFENLNRVLAAIVLLVCVAGCTNVSPAAPQEGSLPSAATNETVARIHWLGKKKISAGPNANGLMQIWNLPESARLEAHILDKLSAFPWQLLRD